MRQRFFPLLPFTGENERIRDLTDWTTALDWELARSDSLSAGEELVTGSKSTVRSATAEIRTLRELGLHTFIFSTSLYVFNVQLFDVKP